LWNKLMYKVSTTLPLCSAHLNFKYYHVVVSSIFISGAISNVHSSDVHGTILLSNIISLLLYTVIGGMYYTVPILFRGKSLVFLCPPSENMIAKSREINSP
jgi:hypothetical protein